ncbi:B12-binding domain-containing radical SAM protein [Oscillatoria sp. FACHB-1406]|uniref:B12-binding domain-containing radical SAM protein n=1 Tax=Oscillatoria sp. FACHB-1406 TaxID=2692846 RepID=UPI001686A5A0|nr:B12-binding domain-containing radical SAM protein [Oscillatoria sp. FACHB-1406]MBD2579990.1 B12-binding domain-containing radical SAM protein [Oscillatoria sp. FACHB-1406]
MRVLLVYPQFPKTFWSFEKILELVDRKVLLPPLGLITVAAILPQTWEFKLVDQNIRPVTEAEWDWAEVVIFSAMIVQKKDLLASIVEAKRRGKRVAAGGPYPTSIPEDCLNAGADYLILDEGEITLPMFVEAIQNGEECGTFRSDGDKPDVTTTPVPRFDLLEFDAYDSMSVQFSRGCPFQCEFCDIIVLYGRKPRTKTPEQLLAELDRLYELGWRRAVFMVDDNFIGNKRNVKLLLSELKTWMAEHQYPFTFNTEASVDLAQDEDLMQLMVECNFNAVFLGIETPDADSLQLTKKFQNSRNSLVDSVLAINRAGLRVMAGFIIGFDGEKTGAGDRIIEFVEQTTIPTAVFGVLQALPHTALWHRLEKEGRLLGHNSEGDQMTLMNFIPTRPVEEIAREYIHAFCTLYEPKQFLDRTYRHFLNLAPSPCEAPAQMPSWIDLKALATVVWRQGFKRDTRWKFWQNLWGILRHNPKVWTHYLTVCAHAEHFVEFRQLVREQVEAQLAEFYWEETRQELKENQVAAV